MCSSAPRTLHTSLDLFLTESDVRVSDEVVSFLVLHLSSHRPRSKFRVVQKYSVRIGETIVVTPRARVLGVDWRIHPRQLLEQCW